MSDYQDSPAATVEETLSRITAHTVMLESESVALANAPGRILREPIRADTDQPPFNRSSVDGYAIRQDDDSEDFRIVDSIRAGERKKVELQPGEAVQIATGARLPGEGLCVVMKEDVERRERSVKIRRRPGVTNIRFQGEDARAGQVLVEPGTILNPGALTLLGSVGCVQPRVTRLPRVVHLITGNELVPCEATPGTGQIRDVNSVLVQAFLNLWGIQPVQVRVPEEKAALLAALTEFGLSRDGVDLLLISGGASVGEHDFTATCLEELGYELKVRRTTTRPGKPLLFGVRNRGLAFGLPGNPLAHFVCLHLYLRHALRRLSGISDKPLFLEGAVACDLTFEPNSRETFWPARLHDCRGQVQLEPLPWRSSGDLTSLPLARALVRVSAGTQSLSRGTIVQYLPTCPDL